eukprot:15116547-Heterocapsa_arctica.AAC.1
MQLDGNGPGEVPIADVEIVKHFPDAQGGHPFLEGSRADWLYIFDLHTEHALRDHGDDLRR